MKVFLVLALAVAARATVIRYAPAAAVLETGDSAQFRSEDNLGNYNFGYNEDHTSGGSFRREAGDAYGNVAGSYGLRDADGRLRIVNYIADDTGFRADIQTNEPGVEPKDPADVAINKGAAVVVESAPPAAIVAPAPLAAVVAAPIGKGISTTTFTASAPAVVATAPVVFPAPAAVPLAKTSTTTVEVAHAPAVVPVAEPAPFVFPAPAAVPVAKGVASVAPAPVLAAAAPFPAAVPVAKGIAVPSPIAIAEAAPITYTSHVAIPQPDPEHIAYGAPAVALAAPAKYSSHVAVSAAAPALSYAVPAPLNYASPVALNHVALAAPAHYGHSFYAPRQVVRSSGIHYSALQAPYHYGHPSPAVSIVGASAYLNPYHFNGVSYVKK